MDYLILCLAAIAAGAVNSVAGGGTLLTFPALLACLGGDAEAAVVANLTSTVALVPGSVAGMWGFRRELREMGAWVALLALPSLLGGVVGSLLVIQRPANEFKTLVPWLILVAAVLFALQPTLGRWLKLGAVERPSSRGHKIFGWCFQFCVAIYGGYFGAGIGILMLTALSLLGQSDIHRMNALKTFLATCINGVSLVVFVSSGRVHWPFALAMAAAAVLGGFGGAHFSRKLDRNLVRRIVVAIGFGLAAYYFFRQYG